LTAGIVFADKPTGMSSAGLVSRLKKRLGGVKTGHTGTLDRFAGGLMILLVGPATSFSDFFLHLDKTYRATISFGSFTDTHDPMGQVMQERSSEEIDEFLEQNENRFASVIAEFEKIKTQTPPLYSALKKEGIRFSDRARKGETILPEEREVSIYSSKLISINKKERSCVCEFHVSSGTYIRSIIRDLAVRLAFPAHLSELYRTSIGAYSVEDIETWRDPDSEPVVIPVEKALDWPKETVPEELVLSVKNGKIIPLDCIHDGNFFLMTPEQKLLAWVNGNNAEYSYKRVFFQQYP